MAGVAYAFGHGAPGGTQERKLEEKQKKLSYGQELQMQMQQQKAQKQNDDNARRGIGQGNADYGGHLAPQQGYGAPMSFAGPPPPMAGVGSPPNSFVGQLPSSFSQPPPSYNAPPFGGFGASPGSYAVPSPGVGAYGPPSPGSGGFALPSSAGGGYSSSPYVQGISQPFMPPPPYQPLPQQQQQQQQPSFQPPPYQAQSLQSYAPPPMPLQHQYGAFPMQFGGGEAGGGFGGSPPLGAYGGQQPRGPGPATMQRMEQKAHKDNYRHELEQQMREKEERKRAEKMQLMAADMRIEQQAFGGMAAGAVGSSGNGGGGGGGANLNAPRGYQQAREVDYGPPGPFQPPQAYSPGGGYGPPPPHFAPPPQSFGGHNGGGPPHGGGYHGGNGYDSNGSGNDGSGGGGGGGRASIFNGNAAVPQFNFRSDKAFLTAGEVDEKARQKQELQDALQQQIDEKRQKKEAEKLRELQSLAREEARLQAEQDMLRQQFESEQHQGKGEKDPKEKVADAWEQARLDVETAKQQKYAAKRGGYSGGPGANSGGGLRHSEDGQQPPHRQQQSQQDGPHVLPPPTLEQPPFTSRGSSHVMRSGGMNANGMPSTPMVEAKVREVAQREIAKVRTELAAEAAGLREVVEAQSQQVAALRSHAERMEGEAAQAKQDMQRMRINAIRRSMEGPEAMQRIMNDYTHQGPPPPPQPLMMHDIGLDLPPPAAVQRRTAAPTCIDMGPLLPPTSNPAAILHSTHMRTIEQQERPLTSGMRLVNPLEASMAAESMFIYPNGREMRTAAPAPGLMPAPPSPNSQPMPFQSIHLPNGFQQSGEGATPLFGRRADLAAAAGRPPVPPTPPDIDVLEQKNQDKLAVLQGLTKLDNNQSLEAMDAFLTRYSRARPALPERTATPVLRINTPLLNAKGMPPIAAQRPSMVLPSGGSKNPMQYGGNGGSFVGRPASTGVMSEYKPLAPLAGVAASRAQSASSLSGRSQVLRVDYSIKCEDTLDTEMLRLRGAAAGSSRPASGLKPSQGVGPLPRSPVMAAPYAGSRGTSAIAGGSRPLGMQTPSGSGAASTAIQAGGTINGEASEGDFKGVRGSIVSDSVWVAAQ